MKYTVLLPLVLAAHLSGCAVQPSSPESTFVLTNVSQTDQIHPFVKAAKNVLIRELPPASSKFHLLEPDDLFGTELVNTLRTEGYSVVETPRVTQIDPATGEPMKVAIPDDAKHLVYVLDSIGKDYYRLLLKINEKTYGALFALTPTGFVQSSPWSAM